MSFAKCFISFQVTFHEQDGMSSSKGESALGQEVRQVVQTKMVHGEQLEKLEGDPYLASDLPSARENFTQVSCQSQQSVLTSVKHQILKIRVILMRKSAELPLS